MATMPICKLKTLLYGKSFLQGTSVLLCSGWYWGLPESTRGYRMVLGGTAVYWVVLGGSEGTAGYMVVLGSNWGKGGTGTLCRVL